MADNNQIKKTSDIYKEAMRLKDIARKSDDHLEKYSEAASKYFEAAEELLKCPITKENQQPKQDALYAYYKYEALECKYGYAYKNGKFEDAQKIAQEADQYINQALQIIDENIDKVNPDNRAFLESQKRNWTLPKKTIKLRQLEPTAKKAMTELDYITAFDTYKQMAVIQKGIYDYAIAHIEDQRMHRIEAGNYAIREANVAMAYAGILKSKNSQELKADNLDVDMLKQFIKAYKLSLAAFDKNPEWDSYRSGAETVFNNIQLLLKKNINRWIDYLIELDNDAELIKIMKKTDLQKFQEIEAKQTIKENKAAELWIYGGFWLLALIVVVGSVITIASYGATLKWTALLLFGVFTLYTLVSASILRSNDKLSEQGYLTLMKLALRLGFENILKLLINKSDDSKNKK